MDAGPEILNKFLAPFRFLYDVIARFVEDDGLISAGYLAYVGVMALLPFLVFVFTLLGLAGQADYGTGIIVFMFEFMPPEVAFTLEEPVRQVVGSASGGVLTLSLLVVLWISGSGVDGIRSALNRAYRTRETRGYWKLRGRSTLFVIAFSGVIFVAVICLIIGPVLWDQAKAYLDFGLGVPVNEFPSAIRFGVGNLSMFIVTSCMYRLLPDHKPGWLEVLPGALAVCGLVTSATSLFSFYLDRFAEYSAIYGSLGGVISTLVFFYILGAILILGAELNAMLMQRRQAGQAMADIRIGTSETGGTFWTEGEAIASLLQRDHGISSDILEAGQASIENARRLDAGLVEFGFMASNWIGRACHGEAPFDDAIDIRMVAPANSGAMFFIARADSDIRNVRDLVGRRVSIGPEGSGMVQHIHTMFGVLGISFDDFTPVYLPFEEGGRALEAGEVDAQWQCPYPNAVMRDISERMDVRVLEYDLPDLASILDRVDYYRPSVMPAGFFRGIDQDVGQLAVVNVVAAHERTDAELVRKFVKTILDNLDELAEMNALFAGLDKVLEPLRTQGAEALEFGGTPFHPGAIQAYRDAGYLS